LGAEAAGGVEAYGATAYYAPSQDLEMIENIDLGRDIIPVIINFSPFLYLDV
jgi:hypothetical protein